MATHKVTWFFAGTTWGWTESLWYNSTDNNHRTTLLAANNVAAARAELLGKECKIFATRVSTEGVSPDALLRYQDWTPTFKKNSKGDITEQETDHEDAALLIRCSNNDDRKHKFIFLRGIWDAIDVNHGKYDPTVFDWGRRMTAYLTTITNKQWGWVGVVNKTAKVPVTGYTADADDRITFTLGRNLFPVDAIGQRGRVRFGGINGTSVLNGLQIVDIISQTSCRTAKAIGAGTYRFGGLASYATYDFIGIKFSDDQKIVERKVGAPLLQSRGRLKNRPRA